MQKKQLNRNNYLFLVGLIFFLFSNSYASDFSQAKQQIWNDMSADVDFWIDGIGGRIDEGIKEIVVALNVLGIKTIASCEGHFDHGFLYPWVDLKIHSNKIESIKTKIWNNESLIGEIIISLKEKYPDLSYEEHLDQPEAINLRELDNEIFLLINAYNQAKMNCLEPINILLNQFL